MKAIAHLSHELGTHVMPARIIGRGDRDGGVRELQTSAGGWGRWGRRGGGADEEGAVKMLSTHVADLDLRTRKKKRQSVVGVGEGRVSSAPATRPAASPLAESFH